VADILRRGLGLKYLWAVRDYLQRAARHIASKTDVEQAYAMGRAAVEFALQGKNSVMPTIVRTSNHPYAWEVGSAPLSEVANVEKMMPAEFMTEDGFGITDACREYLIPLIQGEDYPPYKDGLPDYVTLKNVAVEKKLPAFTL
jgi:ATP-dependent phosphofructokinase / diphosphate-dependent phosphofructokinase